MQLLSHNFKSFDIYSYIIIMNIFQIYLGHTDMVRCVSVDPSGQWLVSGSDDHSVRVWEVSTGRCMKTLTVEGTVKSIAWNPNPSVCLVALTV